jgi:hypothetical protein
MDNEAPVQIKVKTGLELKLEILDMIADWQTELKRVDHKNPLLNFEKNLKIGWLHQMYENILNTSLTKRR